ncbi:hypothetical protein [Mycolicibacterium sp.]|uniref:hypothetical protein n=1 Tax=Mycolicibacterium sp. TaxID=2320850 RepID=UPI003D0F9559
MTTIDERLMGDRLEWRRDDQPASLTTRRFGDLWVASKVGAYLTTEALLAKHREILEAYPDAKVIRLAVSGFDWVERAERRNGYRIA